MADIYLYNNEMWRVKYHFSYTGEMEPFRLNPGRYLCICKGAKGGSYPSRYQNRGGCSYGILNLESPLNAYAVVGGDGGDSPMSTTDYGEGGYNGGGHGGMSCNPGTYRNGAGGGGASDIRLSIEPDIHGFESHSLPEEFDEIEYIESDGTQYMSTEVIGNQNTSVEAGITFVSSFSGWKCPYGAQHSDVFRSHLFGINSLYMTTYQRGDKWHDDSFTFDLNTEYIIKTTSEGLYIDNNKICDIESTADFTTPNPIAIFTKNTNGTYVDSARTIMRLHYMKIWDGDTLVRYFVPYKNVGIDSGVDVDNPGFEQGGISEDTGELIPWTYRLRMIDFVTADANKRYLTITTTGNYNFNIIVSEWDANHNYIKNGSWMNQGELMELDSRTAYFKIVLKYNDVDLYPSDLSGISIRFYSTTRTQSLYDLVNQEFYSRIAGNVFTPGATKVEKTVYQLHTIIKQSLLSRIMVAGGAGGQGNTNGLNDYSDFTGYGGGVNGGYPCVKSGLNNNGSYPTQTSGYAFGQGESGLDKIVSASPSSNGGEGIAGAGGGWYGGYASNTISPTETYSSGNGGGGSGYILSPTSVRPAGYMYGLPERNDLEFADTLMTSGLANEACVIICEPTTAYLDGDRLICDCIGCGTKFKLYSGKYKIRCSGGQGAHRTKYSYARKGGYSEGTLTLPDQIDAYAYVGGSGMLAASDKNAAFIQSTHPTLCFNGGGKPSGYGSLATSGEAAGGGTDLRIGTDSLYARVIVAGGAGGCGNFDSYGGAGGGEIGGTHVANGYGTNYGPGKQDAAGSGSDANISGGFGYGGNGIVANGGYGGAGGGGWYGGSGTYPDGMSDDDYGGDGGSGYVLTSGSFKPNGYLLGEEYYLTDTVLTTGGQDQLFPAPITGLIIEVIYASTSTILAHDSDGYKYYDKENKTWIYLKSDDITLEDFNEYGVHSFDDDTGLKDSYDIYIHDEHDTSNKMEFNVLPPPGDIKFRYHTEHTLTRYNIDSDIDESAIDFNVEIKRKGIAEDAYLYFDFKYNLHDIPKETTRVYCIQGFTQGSSIEYHEPKKKAKTLEHIDLLPVGSSTRMPARFKNYIGSFINGSEAITTINSAVACEHNRCIYSVTLCNDSIVRFAKLNLVNNTSTIIKDIPKSQLGNTYYGDIKVDDDYIYITASDNDNSYNLWRTPNSADPTINMYSVTNDDYHKIQAAGKMEWYDNHTILLMMRKGLAFFDTSQQIFTYKMFADGTQNDARRDYACGKKKVLSLYNGNSDDAYVIDLETNACEVMSTVYGQKWAGNYLNVTCYHDGIFYVVQRNRLHYLDEETMTIDYSIPTPFTDIDPKQIIYGNGILYILTQNKPSLYMYDISTQTFYAAGIPFAVDNWQANGWIRMCAFRGYCFIPQIRLYTINFVDRAKYNMGYKYDQFVIIMNKETSEVVDSQYEYDDRFVTFTDDNMQIHDGVIVADMIEVDSTNHIKLVSMTKDQYNKIIKTSFTKVEDNESEGP